MLLTLATTHRPATDLGFLLAKHPDRCQSFSFSFGQVHVFYPEASEARCEVALLLDIDPVALVRGRRWGRELKGTLAQYVNDRPYAASSFFSVALSKVFKAGMNGSSKERQALADTAIPLTATLSAVPASGGAPLLRALFEPLGYTVEATQIPLDEQFPEWGRGRYFSLKLQATLRLSELLNHLYVLIPVLDDQKHYWVGEDEVEKLLARGGDWLKTHPEKKQITERYLKHRRGLYTEALARIIGEEPAAAEPAPRAQRLNDARLARVVQTLASLRASKILDLGCGEGKLLAELLPKRWVKQLCGVDVSARELERAEARLGLERLPPLLAKKLSLRQGSAIYTDARFTGFDVICLVEVIEHIELSRLAALEQVVFAHAAPQSVLLTTPNIEYNQKYAALAHGRLRHTDHRFEWTRAEFSSWCEGVAGRNNYQLDIQPIGEEDPEVGAPTQMAVFERSPSAGAEVKR